MAEDFNMNSVAQAKSQSQSNAKKTWRDDFNKKYNAAKTDAERYEVINEYQKMMAKGGAIANDSYMKNVLSSKVIDLQKSGYLGKDGKPYSQQELNAALADQSWGSPDVKENLTYYGVPGKKGTQQAKDSEKALKAIANDIKTGNAAGENFKKYTKTDSGKRYTGMATAKPTINGSTGTDILPKEEQPQGAGKTQPEESTGTGTGTNKYLLADMLFTALKNAAGYRPSHRTAYGQSYDGQAGGAEKPLAQKMAEENFKRGLERRNARMDKQAQTEEEMRATQTKAHNQDYVQSANELSKIGATQTQSGSSSSSNLLGSTATSGSKTSFVDPTGLKGPASVQQSN